MMELQIVITMLLQAFRLELAPQPPVEREAFISIRPKNGILFTTAARPAVATPAATPVAA
jgi:cytochrome P450